MGKHKFKKGDLVKHINSPNPRYIRGVTISTYDKTTLAYNCSRMKDKGVCTLWYESNLTLVGDNAQMSEENAIMPRHPPPSERGCFPPVTDKLRGLRPDIIIFDDLITEEHTMKAELTVTKVNDVVTSTKINAQDVQHMEIDQLIGHIQKAEQKVADLEAIKVESKAIKAEIKRLNKFIKDVVLILDKK